MWGTAVSFTLYLIMKTVPLTIGFCPPTSKHLKVELSCAGTLTGAHVTDFSAEVAASPALISSAAAVMSVPSTSFHCKAIGSFPTGELSVIRSEPASPWSAVEGTIRKVCASRGEHSTKVAKNLIRLYYNELNLGLGGYLVMRRLYREIAFLLLVYTCGFPATLSIPNQTADPGQTMVMPVLLAAEGQSIAGIQFDLQWDQSLTIQIASGSTLGPAYKELYSASPSPRHLRCMVVGYNQTFLADGAALNLVISTDGTVAPGAAQVSLTNVIATSGTGDSVPLQAISSTVQIQSGTTQVLPVDSVLNGASMLSGPIVPGEIITLLGAFPIGPPAVLINGVQTPMIYGNTGLLNPVVPFGLDLSKPADLQIRSQNQTVAETTIAVAAAAPAIFTQTGTGTGAGAVLNEDYTVNTFSTPASANSVLLVYGTGFGAMQSLVTDGQPSMAAIPLAVPVTATIGGVSADVIYAGSAPSLIAGVTQINVRVPEGLPSNPYTPLVLSVGSASTPLGITVSIR